MDYHVASGFSPLGITNCFGIVPVRTNQYPIIELSIYIVVDQRGWRAGHVEVRVTGRTSSFVRDIVLEGKLLQRALTTMRRSEDNIRSHKRCATASPLDIEWKLSRSGLRATNDSGIDGCAISRRSFRSCRNCEQCT